ncbi:methylated-DNA--[protein]-cysteine S-methyltransferase [Oscillibacter sp. MSJ-2]|uniref:Methylated-DNA--protein-cysteine methyltransferase n=1 Tax=Dysosmobacter acutus TaxID=2841504 RepID=A0ABS6F7P0_9FIRM|nr:methylated-DNA--[protein]-cysteine S-methyltransferase [Dysosmobacter acutus]MBU5626281.1 methylated-DNA--[protein]-cysteine S-methyltransferase [Dysosmobacter acutus]
MYHSTTYPSPVGTLTLACDGSHLAGLWLEGQKYYGGSLTEELVPADDLPVLNAAKEWLDRYFAGQRPSCHELPLRPAGSPFRQLIWELLREIPYGQVVTYGEIARRAAARLHRETMSAQAVGGAVGHNPISIIVPCHRVVGADGSLTGYAGGIPVKKKLLEIEGADLSGLFCPRAGRAL